MMMHPTIATSAFVLILLEQYNYRETYYKPYYI